MADLSPWPSDSNDAIAELRRNLAHQEVDHRTLDVVEPDPDEVAVLELAGQSAPALVERYAPSAPQRIRDLAVIRVVQYVLARSGAAISMRSEGLGDWKQSIEVLPSQISPLRHSGAMSLLTAWKIRRARKAVSA